MLRVTRGGIDLHEPPATPAGECWHYGLSFPFQAAPRLAGVFANVRPGNGIGVDFENGVDAVLFDDLSNVQTDRAVVICRNAMETNPNASDAPCVMVKHHAQGGFVPLGALRPDGSPHPHAGTGSGIVEALAWPLEASRRYEGDQAYQYCELFQFSFDGTHFRVDSSEILRAEPFPGGWTIQGIGLVNAIPDGDDLLSAVMCGRHADESGQASAPEDIELFAGIARWQRKENKWRAVSFVPVAHGSEPSLIRDTDGSLLFTSRHYPSIRVWRSADNGANWERIIDIGDDIIGVAPMTLNQAADGTPYIITNPFRGTRPGRGYRGEFFLWTLNPERTGVEPPILVRDAVDDFGPDASWKMDHPSAMTVQLADGRWHNVLGYRVMDGNEVGPDSPPPNPHTGSYLEEVLSHGEPIPMWKFE